MENIGRADIMDLTKPYITLHLGGVRRAQLPAKPTKAHIPPHPGEIGKTATSSQRHSNMTARNRNITRPNRNKRQHIATFEKTLGAPRPGSGLNNCGARGRVLPRQMQGKSAPAMPGHRQAGLTRQMARQNPIHRTCLMSPLSSVSRRLKCPGIAARRLPCQERHQTRHGCRSY